jgi:hypothetical protein
MLVSTDLSVISAAKGWRKDSRKTRLSRLNPRFTIKASVLSARAPPFCAENALFALSCMCRSSLCIEISFADFKEKNMQSRILTSVALVLLTAGMALAQSSMAAKSSATAVNAYAAYSVYTYASGTGQGMAGRIVDNGTTVTPHPDMSPTLTDTFTWNGDPTVQGFDLSSSALRIAVTDYTGTAGQPVRIYNATTGALNTTISSGWSNVTNLYGIVKIGSYLYAIDYDNGRVVEINPSTYAQTGVSYTLPSVTVSGTTYYPHGQALLAIGNTLYGLFSYANSGFTAYTNSELVKFAITGNSSISIADSNSNFAQNAYALTANTANSNIYVASIGGEQTAGSYNTGSAIQSISYSSTLSGVTPTTVMSPSSTYPYNFLDISFNTNPSPATAYILMGAYNSGYTGTNGVLLSTTDFTNFTTIDTISNAAGYYWAAQYTTENNRIWYARGNPIWVYDASSTSTPVAQLTLSSGSLLSSGDPAYTNLSNFSFVDPPTNKALRGYRSPVQASNTAWAVKARAITQGRPSLTTEEVEQLNNELNQK